MKNKLISLFGLKIGGGIIFCILFTMNGFAQNLSSVTPAHQSSHTSADSNKSAQFPQGSVQGNNINLNTNNTKFQGLVSSKGVSNSALGYFRFVSKKYAQLKTYQADISYKKGSLTWTGHLIYKAPNKIRIDFTQPPKQVIVSNGQYLRIYMDLYHTGYEQKLPAEPKLSLANLNSLQGFSMLAKHYGISYFQGNQPIILDGTYEKVMALKFKSYSVSENFSSLVIYFSPNGYMRRIEGVTTQGDKIELDLRNFKVNPSLSDSEFNYHFNAQTDVEQNFLSK